MSDMIEPEALLMGGMLARPLDPGETRAAVNQAERARTHAILTTLVIPGALFAVEPGQHEAAMARLAKERKS